MNRRRTPGLRREEVAQRAHVSATWYTWLEQGRGGSPSAEVLDRIARALMLTNVEREHLFFIALGHPPEVRYQAEEGISPRIQRVLDAWEFSPAFVRTVTWDLVAWNRAASAFFAYDALALETVLQSNHHDHARAAGLAHCQNFSAAVESGPRGAAMPKISGFGSGVRRRSFTRLPAE